MATDNPIRILFVEDVPYDAEIAARELQKGGIQFTSTRVDTKEAFLKALEEFRPDLIISDYSMPEFDGMQALKLAKEYAATFPFIVLTGSMNEEIAVKCMKAGAMDYILKDRIVRLPFAVQEALKHMKDKKEKEAAIQSLRESEERYRSVVENIGIGISLISPNMEILALNKQMKTWFPHIDVSSRPICYRAFNDPPREDICPYCPTCKTLQDAQVHEDVTETPAKDKVISFRLISSPVKDQDGKIIAAIEMVEDITERKRAEERIEYLAYYDVLTGLPNRNLFIDRLKQGIARSEHTSKIAAVLVTDIEGFKSINDTYGTEVGDKVLKEIAERLSTAVRKGDTIARLGNDEFGIVLLDVDNLDDLIQVMEKIMKHISFPLKTNSKEIALSFSTGISIYPHDNKSPQDLLNSAGLALGTAKKEGRRTYQFYTEDLNVKASEFLLMEKNLYNSIKNNEFLLHYQPYWDINTQKMVGMEALIRWQSKDTGLVSPGKFIPVLEDTGMIIEVGEWILREAMRQVKEWQNNGYPVVPVSVNMSLVQFRQKNLAEMVRKVMGECGFYPSLLTLEITESAFMQDIEFTRSVLTTMKGIGCSVSIDDFGTGYSSLAHLKRFPVDNLKIDISFIREMVKDPDSASIVLAIISMAHTLNLKTIAEGIETEEQWKFLRLLRCDMGQGFYLSKPLPAEEVIKMLI